MGYCSCSDRRLKRVEAELANRSSAAAMYWPPLFWPVMPSESFSRCSIGHRLLLALQRKSKSGASSSDGAGFDKTAGLACRSKLPGSGQLGAEKSSVTANSTAKVALAKGFSREVAVGTHQPSLSATHSNHLGL